ncbi:hypothetical protein [Streptomyces hygroscopicus]
MMTAGKKRATGDRAGDAQRERDDLRDALKAAWVQPPSLGIGAASCAGPAPLALIDSGRCNVPTARALTAALRSNAGGQQGAAG